MEITEKQKRTLLDAIANDLAESEYYMWNGFKDDHMTDMESAASIKAQVAIELSNAIRAFDETGYCGLADQAERLAEDWQAIADKHHVEVEA